MLRNDRKWRKSLVNTLISPLRKFNKLAIKLHPLLQRPLLLFPKQMNSVHVVGKHREKFVQSMDGSCILVQRLAMNVFVQPIPCNRSENEIRMMGIKRFVVSSTILQTIQFAPTPISSFASIFNKN